MSAPVRETWYWDFSKPPSAIWPLISDTARFNEAAGFSRYPIEEKPQADGSVRYFGYSRVGGFQLAWEEVPSNWVENRWFTHERIFSLGPFRRVKAEVHLQEKISGCVCAYSLEVEPANLLGRLLLWTGFFRKTQKRFRGLVDQFRAFLAGKETEAFSSSPPPLPPGAETRCQNLARELATCPYAHGLEPKLASWILQQPDSAVGSIRPKVLARLWGVPAAQAIDLCLLAAHRGLLSLRWDLLCPNCRVGKLSSGNLDQLPTGTHCGSCNIDYVRDFNRNVELVFSPASTIRSVPLGEYCLFGPQTTPHIVAQLRVNPLSLRRGKDPIPPGFYRIRTLEPGATESWDHDRSSFPGIAFTAEGRLALASHDGAEGWTIENQSLLPRTLIIEQRAWLKDILTAAEAATLPSFRDLFHDQVLRPGDLVQIDSAVLLFTDIRNSTSLYETVGDAAAYALVREHFALLAGCVRDHHGVVVKTIGDAVMATFQDPRSGLVCALAAQKTFSEFNTRICDATRQVVVKMGLHQGPCIAVNLNGILDYYGRTANLASRLASLSQGGDVVVSRTFAEDPGIPPLLGGLSQEEIVAEVKGFTQPIPCLRLTQTGKRPPNHPP
jgi:class 3 adenylate cyclase